MTAAALNHQPVHVGEELGIWEVPNNVSESYSNIVTDSVAENSISSIDSPNKSMIFKECTENVVNSNRSQSLTMSSKSPINEDFSLKRSKSDSSIEICYKDNLNIDDRYKEHGDSDTEAGNEPNEENAKVLSLLKKEIENNIRDNELNVEGILPELKTMLEYGTWKVKKDATLLIADLLPYIGVSEDDFFYELMPLVMENLSHSEHLVTQSSTNLLKTFAESTNDKNTFVEKYISLGILSEDYKIKMASIANIHRIFNEHLSHLNLFHLVQLMVNFLKGEEDTPSRECFIKALKHIRYIEGPKEFIKYQSLLSPKSGKLLQGAFSDQENRRESEDEASIVEKRTSKERKRKRKAIIQINYENGAKLLQIIPGEVLEKLTKNDLHLSRRIGCEELLAFIEWTPDLRELLTNLDTLLSLLNSFKDDSNFGVATISLRVIAVLLTRLTVEEINYYLRSIIHSSTLLFCDERFVVRSEANKTLNGIWQKASPRKVSVLLSEMFKHKSSKVRESSINLITSALLTFPRTSFDFAILSRDVIPKLADPRRRVRQAAMECVATLAQVLGSQNTKILMSEIMDLEETEAGSGVTCAVKARLSRRKLPRLTADGLLEYWLPVFNLAKKNYSGMLFGKYVKL
ncbi:hypothetical protein Avbf_11390 [Armadillidium vulgare]|nr:hypothetical protein Avbf_11390 [Armadillidium vulgare]